jgi:hypothetical protein
LKDICEENMNLKRVDEVMYKELAEKKVIKSVSKTKSSNFSKKRQYSDLAKEAYEFVATHVDHRWLMEKIKPELLKWE